MGSAPVTTAKMAATNSANKRQAWSVSPRGTGETQMIATSASVASRAASVIRDVTWTFIVALRRCTHGSWWAGGRLGRVPPDDSCGPSLTRHGNGIEHAGNLLLRQELPLAHQLDDAPAGSHRLARQLGRTVVANDRIECRHGADAVLEIVTADVRVRGNAVDALHPQRIGRIHEHRLRLEDTRRDHRLEHVELQLAGFSRKRDRKIAPDHAEAHHIDDFWNDRIDLARHDRR